jgi:hypothetical protein
MSGENTATNQSSQGADKQSAQGGATAQSANSSSQTTQQTNSQQQTQQQGQQNGQQQAGAYAAAKVDRPAYVPENFWDAKAGNVKDDFAKHITDLETFRAAEDVRRNSLPQKPEDYKYELPKDFQAPQGLEFKFNENDKSLQDARVAAKELGLTQDGFSRLLGLYAANQVSQNQAVKQAHDAELGKLGAAADARISSVKTFFKGFLGESDGKVLGDTLWTAGIVQAFENLITKVASGHGSNFSQQHREETSGDGKIANYEHMTFEQRRAAQDGAHSARR